MSSEFAIITDEEIDAMDDFYVDEEEPLSDAQKAELIAYDLVATAEHMKANNRRAAKEERDQKKLDDIEAKWAETQSETAIASRPDWDDGLWAHQLKKGPQGIPTNTLTNIDAAFRLSPFLSEFVRYDTFKRDLLCMTDRKGNPTNPVSWTNQHDMTVIKYLSNTAAIDVADPRNIHTGMAEFLADNEINSLTNLVDTWTDWDGVNRADQIATRYLHTNNQEYSDLFMLHFYLSLIERAYNPGCMAKQSLLIQSTGQSLGKSTFVRNMVPEEFWSETLPDISNLQSIGTGLAGVWLLEVAESSELKKYNIKETKRFLSGTKDRYRPLYKNGWVDSLRTTMFVFTTNESQALEDRENVRFMPVIFTDFPKLDEFLADRDQILAEVRHMYMQPDYRTTMIEFTKQVVELADEINQTLLTTLPYQDELASLPLLMKTESRVKSTDLKEALNIKSGNGSSRETNLLTQAMLANGWIRKEVHHAIWYERGPISYPKYDDRLKVSGTIIEMKQQLRRGR